MFFLNNPVARFLIYGPLHGLNLLLRGRFRGPIRLMVEIANDCNLYCKTCYWRKRKNKKALTDKQWEDKIGKILKKHPSVMGAAWLGGEPMLRFGLIKKLSRKFLYNIIITNGTKPLIKAKNISYWVSVDGTKEYFEKQRGPVYEKVKSNILNSKVSDIALKCVISRINQGCMEDFVAEWSKVPNVTKILFSFYTPSIEDKNDDLYLTFKEKLKLLRRLKRVEEKYPKLVGESVKMLRSFVIEKSKNPKKKCRESFHLFYNPEGKKILHTVNKNVSCGFPGGDCSRCGNFSAMKGNFAFKERAGTLRYYLKRMAKRMS